MGAAAVPIMIGMTAASTAYSVWGDRKNAKAAKKTAGFEAGILEEQSEDVLGAGKKAGYRVAAGARSLKGSQVASLAAQGIDVSSGSAGDVIDNDERLAQLDILEIENNAARDALGLRKQAELVRMGGKNTASRTSTALTEPPCRALRACSTFTDATVSTGPSLAPRQPLPTSGCRWSGTAGWVHIDGKRASDPAGLSPAGAVSAIQLGAEA